MIDVRKPNYSLMEQQLESAYASSAAAAQELDASSWLSVLDGSQLYMTRVFGKSNQFLSSRFLLSVSLFLSRKVSFFILS